VFTRSTFDCGRGGLCWCWTIRNEGGMLICIYTGLRWLPLFIQFINSTHQSFQSNPITKSKLRHDDHHLPTIHCPTRPLLAPSVMAFSPYMPCRVACNSAYLSCMHVYGMSPFSGLWVPADGLGMTAICNVGAMQCFRRCG
jgi:hypothetical protein